MPNLNSPVQAKQVQNLLVVDPTANGMANVNVEDLSISVELEVFKRDEAPIIFSNGEVTTTNNVSSEATRISFIDGIGDEENYLTTNYTELTTDFGKDKDVGSLGIETIDISFNTSYVPIVKIRFKDIRARLFELGTESPYSFLFKMPYPIFYLTVKGYYGKPVKYALHLTKFNGELDNDTGSFIITCDFVGYTYAFLSDLLMGILKAIPYTEIGSNLITSKEFTTFEQLTLVVHKLQENITKFNKNNKQLNALSVFDVMNTKLDAIKTNLMTSIVSLNDSYQKINNTNIVGADKISISRNGDLTEIEQKIYKSDVLDLVEDYINLNNDKGTNTYKLNLEDFQLNSEGVWNNDFDNFDFIKRLGNSNYVTKTFDEFQDETSLLKKYPIYRGDSEDIRKKYNEFVSLIDYKYRHNANSGVFNKAENYKFFDIRFAIDKIDNLKTLISDNYKEGKKEVTSLFVDTISDYLENEGSAFDASIGSLFKILCSHVDLFIDVIKSLEKEISTDIDAGVRDLEERDKNNFTDYIDGTGETKISVKPFPEYIEEEHNNNDDGNTNVLVEKWLGSNSKFNNYKEVKFIDDLYDSMIKAAKKDRETIENVGYVSEGWYPVNPLETKAFNRDNDNPWKIVENATVTPIMKLVLQRMSVFLGYSNSNLSENDIKKMAKIEANQLNDAVTNPNIKKLIIPVGSGPEDWKTKVTTLLGDFAEDTTNFGQMGEKYGLRFYSDNDEVVYRHGTLLSNDDATENSSEYIPITQTFKDLNNESNPLIQSDYRASTTNSFGSAVISDVDSNNEVEKNFIKIIDYKNDYKNDYSYKPYLDYTPSVETTKTTGTSQIANVNDFYGGVYRTHEFSTYVDGGLGVLDNYPLSYEFYDVNFKTKLLQKLKKNEPFSFQQTFKSQNKEFSLFGSKWYYAQNDVTRALLFLHSIPFDGVNQKLDATLVLSDKNLKFFNERAGFVLTPDAWLLFIGGLLYRAAQSNNMIKFVDGSGDSYIPNIDDLENKINNSNQLFGYSTIAGNTTTTFVYRNGPINFNTNNSAYQDLGNIIQRLPKSVKTTLKNYFTNWVANGWKEIRDSLEFFKTNITTSELVNFYDNPEGNKNLLNPNNLKNYTYELNTAGGHDIDLTLIDNSEGSKLLNNFLEDKKMLINSTYRIWGGENRRFDRISFKFSNLSIYLKTFYGELQQLNGVPALDATSEIQKQLFNTDNVDDIKLSIYKNIKSIYYKWIVGVHKNESAVIFSDLYKSFNFLDRAYLDISDKFKISPTKFVDMLSTNSNISFYNFIARILMDNNFDFIPLPTFLDYSSPDDAISIFEPQRFKDMAPTNGPQFICMYFGEHSNRLNINKKDDKGDSFKIPSKYDDNGDLVLSDFDELPKDFKVGNRNIPYFLVNYADQNQSLFKKIDLNQAEFTETNESLEIIESLASKNRNNSIGQNLFDIYSNRAYSAEVEMLGCAQIQPFMFFQINNIPMFDGAYTIINTRHSIKANHMTTTFKGVRLRKIKTKMVDNETLYAHLLTNLNEVDNEDASLSNLSNISNTSNRNTSGNNNVSTGSSDFSINKAVKTINGQSTQVIEGIIIEE